MKKVFLAVLLLSIFTCFKNVCAEEANISYHKLDGIYYNLNVNGTLKSNYVTSFYLNDRIAYCVEPGTDINTRVYDIYTDWSVLSFSDDLKEYVEKVGYYGFEYPGHQNDYYYIAAQELIWNAIRPDVQVTWTTGANLSGEVIDISSYKSEIERLVNSHSSIPSFSFNDISGYVGEELVLEDTNNVLDYYDVSSSEHHSVVKEGNTLKIKFNDSLVPKETIRLVRNHYDNAPLLVYSRGDSQKLAAIRITTDKDVEFNLFNKELPKEDEEIVDVPDTGIDYYASKWLNSKLIRFGMVNYAVEVN